jgi:uroporphyrinogen-III synthase
VTEPEGPLGGVGVVVTRPARDAEEPGGLGAVFRRLGAEVVHWPALRSLPPADLAPLRSALEMLHRFDWLVLTSARAVEAVAVIRPALPPGIRVAAVGEGTARAAVAVGWWVDLVPPVQTGSALAEALRQAGHLEGRRLLFPSSEIARETTEAELRVGGAEVVRVTAYRTLPAALDREACRRDLEAGRVQVTSFTSPSSVEGLRSGLGEALFREVVERTVVAVIGPTTAAAVARAGAPRCIEAGRHSFEGLAERVADWVREGHRTGETT